MSPIIRRIESGDEGVQTTNEDRLQSPSPDIVEDSCSTFEEKGAFQEEEDWRLLQIIPPRPLFAPLPVEQKKGEQNKGAVDLQNENLHVLDKLRVSAYQIKMLLKPWSILSRLDITYVSSNRGILYFKQPRGVRPKMLSWTKVMRPSWVQAKSKWAKLLLEPIAVSINTNTIVIDLTSAQPKVLKSLLESGPAGVSAIKDFMEDLSHKNVCVSAYDNSMKEVSSHHCHQLIEPEGDIISAATGLALIIRLKSKDDILFSRLVGYSPSTVIQEIATYQRGALVSNAVLPAALKYVVEALIVKLSERNYKMSKDIHFEVAANLVSTYIKSNARQSKRSLKRVIGLLISKIKPDANEDSEIIVAAIITGTIIVGAIKQAIEIATIETKPRDDIEKGVDITLSVLACCGTFDLDKVNSLATFIVDICIDKGWKLKYEALVIWIEDFVTGAVYWPLINDNVVPLSTSKWKDKLTAKDIIDFKSCFKLVMHSNHLSVDALRAEVKDEKKKSILFLLFIQYVLVIWAKLLEACILIIELLQKTYDTWILPQEGTHEIINGTDSHWSIH